MNIKKYVFNQMTSFLLKRYFERYAKRLSSFEAFAYHMVNMAQQKRIDKEFDLNGTFYAFDSTAIDLCLSLDN